MGSEHPCPACPCTVFIKQYQIFDIGTRPSCLRRRLHDFNFFCSLSSPISTRRRKASALVGMSGCTRRHASTFFQKAVDSLI